MGRSKPPLCGLTIARPSAWSAGPFTSSGRGNLPERAKCGPNASPSARRSVAGSAWGADRTCRRQRARSPLLSLAFMPHDVGGISVASATALAGGVAVSAESPTKTGRRYRASAGQRGGDTSSPMAGEGYSTGTIKPRPK